MFHNIVLFSISQLKWSSVLLNQYTSYTHTSEITILNNLYSNKSKNKMQYMYVMLFALKFENLYYVNNLNITPIQI